MKNVESFLPLCSIGYSTVLYILIWAKRQQIELINKGVSFDKQSKNPSLCSWYVLL